MTIKEKIRKKVLKGKVAAFLFWLLFAGGMFVVGDEVNPFYMLIPFVGFGGAILYLLLFIKCPKCKAGQGQMALQAKELNFCYSCGENFNK